MSTPTIKLVEAVMTLRHCPHNVHKDDSGRPVYITINYRLYNEMVEAYNNWIAEHKDKQ
jgi:hypothetical protein